eukprot:7351687-Prymnesium_polylepis.1
MTCTLHACAHDSPSAGCTDDALAASLTLVATWLIMTAARGWRVATSASACVSPPSICARREKSPTPCRKWKATESMTTSRTAGSAASTLRSERTVASISAASYTRKTWIRPSSASSLSACAAARCSGLLSRSAVMRRWRSSAPAILKARSAVKEPSESM